MLILKGVDKYVCQFLSINRLCKTTLHFRYIYIDKVSKINIYIEMYDKCIKN